MSNKSRKRLETIDIESPKPRSLEMNTGLSEAQRTEIAEGLKKVLADSYCLMLMSHNYHWNVKGMHFHTIHEMTEEHYTELFEAIDVIAERIRALGHLAPGTLSEFNDLTSINIPNSDLSEMEMVADLLEAHEAITRSLRNALAPADEAGDEATLDLITERLDFHEKTSWMFRSMLER